MVEGRGSSSNVLIMTKNESNSRNEVSNSSLRIRNSNVESAVYSSNNQIESMLFRQFIPQEEVMKAVYSNKSKNN